MATKCTLEQCDEELILYGRNISSRITDIPKDRVTLVDGNFTELDTVEEDENNTNLVITEKGQEFRPAQVTREAVTQFVVDVTTGRKEYQRASLDIGEPGTELEKPSFM